MRDEGLLLLQVCISVVFKSHPIYVLRWSLGCETTLNVIRRLVRVHIVKMDGYGCLNCTV